jgi:hypothetical protein
VLDLSPLEWAYLLGVHNYSGFDEPIYRCLSVQRSTGCVWFGEMGRCGTYNLLLAILAPCAIGDFLVTLIMVWLSRSTQKVQNIKMRLLQACLTASSCDTDVLGVRVD